MHIKNDYRKWAPFTAILLTAILLISFSTIPSIIPLSDNKSNYKALAQQQQLLTMSNNGQASEDGSNNYDNNITIVARFNASQGQLPEGVAIMGDSVFISFAPLVQVVRLNESLSDDHGNTSTNTSSRNQNDTTFTEVGSWPDIPQNGGFMIGLAFDMQGNLYAAISSQTPEVQSGIYRIEPDGVWGNATLFATHPMMQFPNDLVFDERGQLYISDSGAGTIFLADANGTVTEWVSHPLLQGNSTFCANVPDLQMNVGANGMALVDRNQSSLLIANSDKASIIRVPITQDGSAEEPEIFVGPDCENLAGADGMVMDEMANDLIIAVNKQDKIVKLSMDNNSSRTISTIASSGVLDFPASLAIKNDDIRDAGNNNSLDEFAQEESAASDSINAMELENRTLYITNFAFLSAQQNPEGANPALLSLLLNISDADRQNQTNTN